MEDDNRPRKDKEKKEKFFREVYEEYKKPLGTFLYRLLAQKYEMEDMYQEVLKKFWDHLQTIDELPTPGETGGWLFTTARRQVIDQYRKQNKLISEPLGEVEQKLYQPISIEDLLCDQERLQWAFANMSSMYRICLVLQCLYGYPQKEIARQLQIKKQTVSTNVLRGRKQLSMLLDDIRWKKEEDATRADGSTE